MNKDAHGLNVENLLSILPPVLANDPDMKAIAESVAGILVENDKAIDSISIYPNIDNASEDLCDILAKDFDVTWYDYNYSLEQKRAMIKSNFNVHRHLGTVGAVNDLVSAAFKEGIVQEWFDYGGEPYHFKIILQEGSNYTMTDESIALFSRLIENVKNLRSHLDVIEAHRPVYADVNVGAVIASASSQTMGMDYTREQETYIENHVVMACIGEGIGKLEANFGRDVSKDLSAGYQYAAIIANAATYRLEA